MRCVVAVISVVAIGLPAAVFAAATTGFSAWTFGGSANDYHGTLQISPRFPTADFVSDSRAGQVGVQSGSSAWFGAWTPAGQVFGSSQNQPYLNLRPKTDQATGASTTTYAFARPTPLGWGFVLGDIDADQVRVSAVTAAGAQATASELGFQGVFNYCEQTPRPSGCGGTQTDVPTWNAATQTLTGNAGASDTTGASGWFRPTVPLRTVTFEFTARSGFPVYQAWFAVRMQDLTGTVSVASGSCDLAGMNAHLYGQAGNQIGETTTGADGRYSFTELAAGPGYSVRLSGIPSTCRAVGPTTVEGIDLTDDDGTGDFAIRALVPSAVLGTVTDRTTGDPVSGVPVTLELEVGGTATTETADDGSYVFDDVPAGSHVITVTPPDGYAGADPGSRTVVVPDDSEDPIVDQDFELSADPNISGRVTAGGEPLAGVVVELRDMGGTGVGREVTGPDGSYTFAHVPGDTSYVIAIPDPPGGYRPPADRSADVESSDVVDQDFKLVRPGAIGGVVTDADGPVVGVEVTLTGPSGSVTRTTDGAGHYYVDDLDPGRYVVMIETPDGTTPDVTSRTVEITEAGEVFGAEDFLLSTVSTPSPGDDDTGAGSPPVDAGLPDTGAPSPWWPVAGALSLLAGIMVLGQWSPHRLP